MILYMFLFDKETSHNSLMRNANEYCQGLCQSSEIILCDYSLNNSGFCENLITDSSLQSWIYTSNFFDDDKR